MMIYGVLCGNWGRRPDMLWRDRFLDFGYQSFDVCVPGVGGSLALTWGVGRVCKHFAVGAYPGCRVQSPRYP